MRGDSNERLTILSEAVVQLFYWRCHDHPESSNVELTGAARYYCTESVLRDWLN
jgi:hypothetical protein